MPSTSKHGTSRGLPIKEVLEYLLPELDLSCLRLALNTPKVTEQLMKLDEQGVNAPLLCLFWLEALKNLELAVFNFWRSCVSQVNHSLVCPLIVKSFGVFCSPRPCRFPAEFPGEGWSDVLPSGPVHRRGDVQQRDSRSRPGRVSGPAWGESSPQGLHQVQSPAGHQK